MRRLLHHAAVCFGFADADPSPLTTFPIVRTWVRPRGARARPALRLAAAAHLIGALQVARWERRHDRRAIGGSDGRVFARPLE